MQDNRSAPEMTMHARSVSAVRRAAVFVRTVLVTTLASVLLLVATVFLLAAAFLGAGCAFTQKVVNRQILKSPEMRFEDTYTDRDRDLLDITGLAGGAGGGGGGGGC